MTSRVKNNPDSNIHNMIQSLISCGATVDNCELLIKYDQDDEDAKKIDLTKYPINVKRFCWSRGEGRHSIHLDHFYLFSKHSKQSRFVMLSSDDFTFTRKGFIDDILAIKEKYAFVGPARPRVELYSENFLNENYMNVWKHNEGVSLPCMTTQTLKVLQNYGWQCNADNWVTLICILLYRNYKLDLWKTVTPFFIRNPTSGTSGYGDSFNEMEFDGNKNPKNSYYFELVNQQVKNLYYNLLQV